MCCTRYISLRFEYNSQEGYRTIDNEKSSYQNATYLLWRGPKTYRDLRFVDYNNCVWFFSYSDTYIHPSSEFPSKLLCTPIAVHYIVLPSYISPDPYNKDSSISIISCRPSICFLFRKITNSKREMKPLRRYARGTWYPRPIGCSWQTDIIIGKP